MGNDIRDNRTNAAMSVGIVPQEIVCDPFLTVAETLVFQSGFFGLRNNEAWLDTIVSKLGLEDKISTPVRMLSGEHETKSFDRASTCSQTSGHRA